MVVINKKVRNAVIPMVALSTLMVLDGCKEDEVMPKFSDDLLIGDWEVTEVDGDDYTDYDYQLLFRFEANKDFDICTSYTYDGVTESYCYSELGQQFTWKWQDASNSAIVISNPPEEDTIADVVVLNGTNMELDVTYDGGSANYKFIKIN